MISFLCSLSYSVNESLNLWCTKSRAPLMKLGVLLKATQHGVVQAHVVLVMGLLPSRTNVNPMSLPHITHRLMLGSVTTWCRKKRDKKIQPEQRREETRARCSIPTCTIFHYPTTCKCKHLPHSCTPLGCAIHAKWCAAQPQERTEKGIPLVYANMCTGKWGCIRMLHRNQISRSDCLRGKTGLLEKGTH